MEKKATKKKSGKKEAKASIAWNTLFNELGILEQLEKAGIATVTADQIKKISGEEARLMAKWDESRERPDLFKNHEVLMLPVTNGEYRLIQTRNGYTPLTALEGVEPVLFRWPQRHSFETLPSELKSESQVIDACVASGLLEQFIHDAFPGERLTLTVRGRLRSPDFDFSISDLAGREHRINVNKVQIEVDGGYEGPNCFVVIEAKMRSADDMITRQLSYPCWMWRSEGVEKPIIPIYIGYSNSTISLIEFEEPAQIYEPLIVRRLAKYVFDDTPPEKTLSEIVLNAKPSAEEPKRPPFPQADSLDRVIDTIDLVARGFTSSADISEQMQVDARQGDYYANSAIYLGMLERNGREFVLTDVATRFLSESPRRRLEMIAIQAVRYPVFYKTAQFIVENGSMPQKTDVAKWIMGVTKYGRKTANRRASTVVAWANRLWKNLA